MEIQGILNNQKYLEKEQSWETHTSQVQNLVQSNNNQYHVIPAQG